MKSFLLSTVLVLFFFSFAAAQGFGVGIKVGTNINKMAGNLLKTSLLMVTVPGYMQMLKQEKNGASSPKCFLTR